MRQQARVAATTIAAISLLSGCGQHVTSPNANPHAAHGGDDPIADLVSQYRAGGRITGALVARYGHDTSVYGNVPDLGENRAKMYKNIGFFYGGDNGDTFTWSGGSYEFYLANGAADVWGPPVFHDGVKELPSGGQLLYTHKGLIVNQPSGRICGILKKGPSGHDVSLTFSGDGGSCAYALN